jgi:hypothetical protein
MDRGAYHQLIELLDAPVVAVLVRSRSSLAGEARCEKPMGLRYGERTSGKGSWLDPLVALIHTAHALLPDLEVRGSI